MAFSIYTEGIGMTYREQVVPKGIATAFSSLYRQKLFIDVNLGLLLSCLSSSSSLIVSSSYSSVLPHLFIQLKIDSSAAPPIVGVLLLFLQIRSLSHPLSY